MTDLRTFLEVTEHEYPQEVVRIRDPIDPVFEAQAVIEYFERRGQHPIIVFENLKGFDMPAVTNVHGTRDRIARAMGTTKEALTQEWIRRSANLIPPEVVPQESAPVQEIVWEGNDADLTKLPVFTHFEQDGGPYISAGVLVAHDPETGVANASFHRCQVKGFQRLGVSLDSRRHLWDYQRRAEERGEPLPVAIVIGNHPAMCLAAVSMDPIEVDEYQIAGAFLGRPVRVTRCRTVDVLVPADAEIVIEGEFPPGVREPEGPFGEFTGYVSRRSTNHVIEVKAITMRRRPIYQDIACGFSAEHSLLGAIPREPNVYKAVRVLTPTVKNVCYPISGTCRFHCYVSIHKTQEGQPKNTIMAAFGADHYLKLVVVVDEDIDVFDDKQVLWAMATRMQASNDLFVVPKGAAALLDPSSVQGMADKVGIDATAPLVGWEAVKPTIPEIAQSRIEGLLSTYCKGS